MNSKVLHIKYLPLGRVPHQVFHKPMHELSVLFKTHWAVVEYSCTKQDYPTAFGLMLFKHIAIIVISVVIAIRKPHGTKGSDPNSLVSNFCLVKEFGSAQARQITHYHMQTHVLHLECFL